MPNKVSFYLFFEDDNLVVEGAAKRSNLDGGLYHCTMCGQYVIQVQELNNIGASLVSEQSGSISDGNIHVVNTIVV